MKYRDYKIKKSEWKGKSIWDIYYFNDLVDEWRPAIGSSFDSLKDAKLLIDQKLKEASYRHIKL